jgi:hypothetical protein
MRACATISSPMRSKHSRRALELRATSAMVRCGRGSVKRTRHQFHVRDQTGAQGHVRQQRHAQPAFDHLRQREQAGCLHAPGARFGQSAATERVATQTMAFFEQQQFVGIEVAYFAWHLRCPIRRCDQLQFLVEQRLHLKGAGVEGKGDQREIQLTGSQTE